MKLLFLIMSDFEEILNTRRSIREYKDIMLKMKIFLKY